MLERISQAIPTGGAAASAHILTLYVLVGFLVIAWIVTSLQVRTLKARLARLTRSAIGRNIEEELAESQSNVEEMTQNLDIIRQAVAVLQAQMPECLRRVDLVRYDAFEHVGGEQSFSVALLNAEGDGVVLTSVYNRMDGRVYAKSIRGGRSSHALSEEEQRVIKQAIAQ